MPFVSVGPSVLLRIHARKLFLISKMENGLSRVMTVRRRAGGASGGGQGRAGNAAESMGGEGRGYILRDK